MNLNNKQFSDEDLQRLLFGKKKLHTSDAESEAILRDIANMTDEDWAKEEARQQKEESDFEEYRKNMSIEEAQEFEETVEWAGKLFEKMMKLLGLSDKSGSN